MSYIKELRISGFRKFKEKIAIKFKPHMNILVGENESGKSSILEAINIVLNQWYRNMDKNIIKEIMNIENIKDFKNNPTLDNLPKILIELDIDMDDSEFNPVFSSGQHYENQSGTDDKTGISFKCEFNDDFQTELIAEIQNGQIPFEYYNMTWQTYNGDYYNSLRKPIKAIFIDTDSSDTTRTFNSFHRDLFNSEYDSATRLNVKNTFREQIEEISKNLKLSEIDEHKKLGINHKKLILENLLSLYEDDIPLENKGRGHESLIKTEVALNRAKDKIDLVLLEEPENHLSHATLLKMIQQIAKKKDGKQIILTTHNSMIASRLNLDNVMWLEESEKKSLEDISSDTNKFFTKLDNNNFLTLLLSKKVLLVEGASEYILLPELYRLLHKSSFENDYITIISCNGITYSHYLEIVKGKGKKIAVITDNDKKQSNIEKMDDFNSTHTCQQIFMDKDIKNCWTFEACLFFINNEICKQHIELKETADYRFHGENYDRCLGKMLNNKADIAFTFSEKIQKKEITEFQIPEYIQKAFEWLKK